MPFLRVQKYYAVLVGLLCFGTLAQAQQQPTVEDYYQLQRRVLEQERRLQSLETQRSEPALQVSPISNTNLDASVEGRLSELEEYVHDLGKPEPANGKPTQKWTGRIHYDHWVIPSADPLINFLGTGDPTNGPKDFSGFRRLRLGLQGDITDTMLYKIEFDFAIPVGLAFKDSYLGWDELPFFQKILLGNQKRPYGLDHLNSSRYNVFLERPFTVEAFNSDARRTGIQSYGVSSDERWNWRYGYFHMDDIAKLGGQRTDHYQSEVAGRLANTIWYDESSDGRGYAHWAVSSSLGFPSAAQDSIVTTRPEARSLTRWYNTGRITNGHRHALLGLEGVVNVGALQIVGEYQMMEIARNNNPNLNVGGGYVYVSYFLTGEHIPWSRKSGTIGRVKPFENFFFVDRCSGGTGYGMGAWQIAARYSHVDFSDDNIYGGVGNQFTAGLNWWWTPNSRLQFNYIYGHMKDRADVGGTPWVAGETSGRYDIFGVRFAVDF